MKTVLLFISLWTLTYAHPVPNHPNVHDGSSKEWRVDSYEISAALRYATSEESMNEEEDPAEKDGEDTDSSPYDSTETEVRDSIADEYEHDGILHETNEGNNYPVGVSSHSSEHHTEDFNGNDVDESITQDNDDDDDSVRIKQGQHKNWVYQKDSVALEELDEHSLEDVNKFHEDHHTGDSREPKQHYNTEDNGPLYKTKRFYSQMFNKEINDLIDEEDDSGDDTFDENQGDTNGKDPSYTVNPNGVDEYTAFDNGVHHRGHGDTAVRKKDSDSSSSSSSSESRGLDSREYRNHIISRYDRSLGNIGDSARTSHKDSYDFDDEGMQGDDPSIFESEGGKSKMTRSAIHSKESSQESSREPRKAKLNGISKSVENSNSHKFQNDDNNSGEDDSIEQDNSQSMEADEAKSGEDSQSAEDSSHSEESVASHSRKDVSRSREDVTSHSREDVASQSSEENGESHEENEKIYKEMKSKSNEYSGSKSKEDRDSYEDDSKPLSIDSESAEDQGDKSRSREKSKSTEDSMESEEDKNDSISDDSRLSHSKSAESKSISREFVGSESREDDRSEEVQGQDSRSAETYDSGSKEEEHSHSREMDSYSHSREMDSYSHSRERDSHSREDATNESTSHEDDSLPRSMEMENRKLMFDVYHNKPIGDYDDNDCQDGY
ncbi:PREDICTED: dentin matrix acidic phosphoprotein 1 [Crocodylus porosus]|uniref:Dentin matrix acidic phosphoprotein 1 n=12 Tax=Crocodylidae TaxID=8493 RepID=A0A7M4F370_CROPO|nr:PREDICTED: dentin matrix acidic phosphoprotein 1 [Crocodylus porosus]